MNQITVISREWLNEFLDGSSLTSGSGIAYPKMEALERVRVLTTFSVKTFVLATSANEFLFETDGVSATLTMSLSNWATEGFKVGDDVKLLYGGNEIDEAVQSISGNVITISDSGIVAALGVVSGTYYDSMELRNITVPTTVNFKFGIVPNIMPPPSLTTAVPNPYGSWIDGQIQAYTGSGMAIATPVTLTETMTSNAEISESVIVEYGGVTSDYIFEFTCDHIFRAPAYKVDYLTNFINNTSPYGFTIPNSFRYIAWYNFGTSATDPNEYRIFNDNLLNGSYGWINNNFTSGTGNYTLESITITDPDAVELDALEATVVNSVAIQVKKTTGNFAVGTKAIVFVMKLPSDSEYAGVTTDWTTNHIFDSVTNTDGTAPVDGDFIKQVVVDVNVDTTLLDVTFDVEYSANQIDLISNGDRYFIGVQVGDYTMSADLSDRKILWCQCGEYTKNQDQDGLINNWSINFYTIEKTPGVGTKTNNVDTWDNRMHFCVATFNLAKFANSWDSQIISIDAQIVSRQDTTNETFVVKSVNLPFTSVMLPVDGTLYAAVNTTGAMNFNLNPDDEANEYSITSEQPVAFDANQQWTVVFPFEIPWRTVIENLNVSTSFYDSAEPNNNFNEKTSNYSNVDSYRTYVRLLVKINYNGVTTEYGLYSRRCNVRDFDVDPDTFNWTGETKMYDSDGNEIDYIQTSEDTIVETTFSMATAGGLTYSRLRGHVSLEKYNTAGDCFRLHSSRDWWYPDNVLKPEDGEDYVTITQDVPNNTIKLRFAIDHTKIDEDSSYTIMSHLEDTTN
jgi:hypothetical protein